MRHSGKKTHLKHMTTRRFSTRLLSGLGALLAALSLMAAASASAATFETVDHFGGALSAPSEYHVFPEEAQLSGVSDLAINSTGAGGVAPGTIYSIESTVAGESGRPEIQKRVTRFAPAGDFEEAWNLFTGERCGPATEDPAHPGEYAHCTAPFSLVSPGAFGIAVDQATGNIYVLTDRVVKEMLVPVLRVYNPNGTILIAEFGEADPSGTIAESPGKIHHASKGGIAVNDSGDVYVFDEDKSFHHRVMVFRPQSPGDYEHYVYAGQGSDIAVGTPSSGAPEAREPALDLAGHLYGLVGEEALFMYDLAQPSTPTCGFNLPAGGITAFTVNPVNGELFYYSYKNRQVHQLKCNGEGKFVEVSVFAPTPVRGQFEAMTMDGGRKYTSGRSAGVLYGAATYDVPGTGSGGEPGAGSLGYIFAPAEENPPEVISESVANVTTTTATLRAQINPKGSPTRYVFQYISQATYEANEPSDRFAGATEAPLGGASLGEGQGEVSAAVALSGLTSDTAYRYRVVATSHCVSGDESKICEDAGADEVFRTYPAEAPVLPDGRAWELVSPAQKNGGEVFPLDPSTSSCGRECKPGIVASRFPQQSSPNGDEVVYEGFPFSFGGGSAIFNQYISKRTSSGWQTTTLSPKLQGSGEQGFVGFDAGLNRGLLYQVLPSLTPEAPTDYANFYSQSTAAPAALNPLLTAAPPNRLDSIGTGSLELTYVGASADFSRIFFEANDALTEATPFAPTAVDGGASKNNLYEWSAEGLRLVNVAPGNASTAPGAAFGERENPPYERASLLNAISADGSRVFWSDEASHLYVREDAESTTEIPVAGKFLSAAPDGSEVLLSNGKVYDLETETTTDLTEGKGGFEGIAAQSEDFSHIYFVDTEVLDETPNQYGDIALKGKDNLYSRHGGSSTFIATLLQGDGPASGGRGTWSSSPATRTAEASPNGRWLAFLSEGEPTGYDNVSTPGICPRGAGEPTGPCPEAFLYDSATGELRCASCNPSGTVPLGPAHLPLIQFPPAYLPQPRYLTDEGRLYFDTRDSLSAFDTNDGVEDVYQYEPGGIGSCEREAGCVSLISAGHEAIDSNLLGVDATGKNVFFTSRDQLTLRDRDDLIDLYDAREGGGIASETETGRGECQGEACQVPVSPPNDPTPGSSTFQGAGNVTEPKAARKHAKKHKKKHAKKKHAHKRAAKHNRGGAK